MVRFLSTFFTSEFTVSSEIAHILSKSLLKIQFLQLNVYYNKTGNYFRLFSHWLVQTQSHHSSRAVPCHPSFFSSLMPRHYHCHVINCWNIPGSTLFLMLVFLFLITTLALTFAVPGDKLFLGLLGYFVTGIHILVLYLAYHSIVFVSGVSLKNISNKAIQYLAFISSYHNRPS